jgi:hypothetical protein
VCVCVMVMRYEAAVSGDDSSSRGSGGVGQKEDVMCELWG